VKPGTLSVAAGVVWEELAPICLHMGTLTSADVPTFSKLCELEATFRDVARQKDAEGFAIFAVTGVHAAIKVERETATALRPYYDYFGMTPSSRARIRVREKDEAPQSKWAGALK
jgi:phage terminase small subunit